MSESADVALARGGPAELDPGVPVATQRAGSAVADAGVVVGPGAPEAVEPSALEQLRARGRLRHGLGLLGPAFVAAVAYVDPGNFATNIAGGSQYGYLLLWVILAANLMAMLIQYLSAKVGIATGRNLPELCREHFPRAAALGLWIQAELIAMATDLAEFVGAAIARNARVTTIAASAVAGLIIALNLFLLVKTFLG